MIYVVYLAQRGAKEYASYLVRAEEPEEAITLAKSQHCSVFGVAAGDLVGVLVDPRCWASGGAYLLGVNRGVAAERDIERWSK